MPALVTERKLYSGGVRVDFELTGAANQSEHRGFCRDWRIQVEDRFDRFISWVHDPHLIFALLQFFENGRALLGVVPQDDQRADRLGLDGGASAKLGSCPR